MFQIIVSVRFGHLQSCHLFTQNYLCIVLPEPQDATLFWKTWVYVYDMLMMGIWSEKMGDFHPLRLGPMLLTKTVSWDRKLREAEEVCFWDDIDLDIFPRKIVILFSCCPKIWGVGWSRLVFSETAFFLLLPKWSEIYLSHVFPFLIGGTGGWSWWDEGHETGRSSFTAVHSWHGDGSKECNSCSTEYATWWRDVHK